ncbi:MAG TPA: glycosyltransferase family 4 protein [Dehalococcoidia bacterium]|nr:glycosyltransferase family 4 protein [Dehalococcoidia bacterium]
MRILLICALDVWSLDRGKGAPTLERTLRAYADAGHTVDAVLPDIGANHFYDGAAPAPESRPEIPGVRFHTFHMPGLRDLAGRVPGFDALPAPLEKVDQKLRFALAFPWLAAKQAEAVLRSEPPFDLLYAYEAHAVLAARLLRRRGVRLPLVVRYQGTIMYPALKDRLLYYRRYEEALALKTRADLYIVTDDGTQGDEVLARLSPASKGRVKFWRNGLELDRLHAPSPAEREAARASLSIPDGAFVLLTASRLATWKRIDRAIRALPKVRAWVPGAMLLVAGDGEERARLEALARSVGVADAVRFAGAVRQTDVMTYMHASDVFLAVADLSNVGNPLLEAMTCGMCIVAVDAGDTRELIEDGGTGRLVDSSQRSGIAKALEERLADLLVALAADAGQRARLAAGAEAYARRQFWTWDQRMAAEVDAVQALAPGAGGPRTATQAAPGSG